MSILYVTSSLYAIPRLSLANSATNELKVSNEYFTESIQIADSLTNILPRLAQN